MIDFIRKTTEENKHKLNRTKTKTLTKHFYLRSIRSIIPFDFLVVLNQKQYYTLYKHSIEVSNVIFQLFIKLNGFVKKNHILHINIFIIHIPTSNYVNDA